MSLLIWEHGAILSIYLNALSVILICILCFRRNEDVANIDSSMSANEKSKTSKNEDKNEYGRKLTLWSTSFSTLTVTSTSFLTGTTVTVTARCTIPGFLAAQSCITA